MVTKKIKGECGPQRELGGTQKELSGPQWWLGGCQAQLTGPQKKTSKRARRATKEGSWEDRGITSVPYH